jgi:sporulation protein YlmC with PRC-barrel domain
VTFETAAAVASIRGHPRQERFPAPVVSSHQPHGGETMSLEANEIGNLIGSDKVEGTAVYGADNNKIGSIERVMIDKKSGRVSYAVLSFGGFLGIGDDHYPLPWQSLKYDTSLGGYVTGVTEAQLKGAPRYGNDNAWNWGDPARTRAVNDYYGVAI